ncbi:MAG: SpoIIE family protein phosphatase [Pseudomonadota bacterium]
MRRFGRDRSIATRLIVGTAVVLLLVVFVLTTVIARGATRLLEAQTESQLTQLVDQSARALGDFLDSRRATLDLWASDSLMLSVVRDPALSAVFLPGLSGYLRRYARREAWIDDVIIFRGEQVQYALSGEATEITLKRLVLPGPDGEAVPTVLTGARRLALTRTAIDQGQPMVGQFIALVLDVSAINAHLFSDIRPSEHGVLMLTDTIGEPLVPCAAKAPCPAPGQTSADLLTVKRDVAGTGLAIVGLAPRDDIAAPVREMVMLSAGFGLVAILFGTLLTVVVSRILTAPIRKLTQDARRSARTHLREPALSPSPRGDEVGELADVLKRLDETTTKLTETNQVLEGRNQEIDSARKSLSANLRRLERELEAARQLQMSMVPDPQNTDAIPPVLAIEAAIEPAREVGGDLYDYFLAGPSTFCVFVGDVSDKGTPSALFMARTISLIRFAVEDLSREGMVPDPAAVLSRVNAALSHGNATRMFVTMVFGMLHLPSGRFSYANAGHPTPIVLHAEGGLAMADEERPDMPLGVRANAAFVTRTRGLADGDRLFFYTDGVTEAQDEAGRFFTRKGLMDVLGDHAHSNPDTLVRAVRSALSGFVARAEQGDDITMLALAYDSKRLTPS